MSSPLPDVTETAAAAEAAERSLAAFEATLAGLRFSATSSQVTAVTDGLTNLVSVTVPTDLLNVEAGIRAGDTPPPGPRLFDMLKSAVNAALDTAKSGVTSQIASFASVLSLAGLPGNGSALPDYARFEGSVSDVEARQEAFESSLAARSSSSAA